MAMYETKHGPEDFKISSYYKKDYTSYHTIGSVLWVTVGYVTALGIGGIAFMDEIMAQFSVPFLVMLTAVLATLYLVLLLFYGTVASRFYSKKHNDARQRVKRFNYDLTRLNRMYEKERK